MAAATSVSLEEYLSLPERPGVRYELLKGRLVELSSPSPLHGGIVITVGRFLAEIAEKSFPHLFVASNSEFIMGDESGQSPDVYVVDRARLRNMARYRGASRGAPELAVEIVSPSELADDVDEKVALYLAAGTKTVWVIMPKRKHVLVYDASGVRNAALGDFVDAPAVMPGVQIPVARLFPEI